MPRVVKISMAKFLTTTRATTLCSFFSTTGRMTTFSEVVEGDEEKVKAHHRQWWSYTLARLTDLIFLQRLKVGHEGSNGVVVRDRHPHHFWRPSSHTLPGYCFNDNDSTSLNKQNSQSKILSSTSREQTYYCKPQ